MPIFAPLGLLTIEDIEILKHLPVLLQPIIEALTPIFDVISEMFETIGLDEIKAIKELLKE